MKIRTLGNGLWNTIIDKYNEEAQIEGWPKVPGPGWNHTCSFNCTVKHFMDETYGKLPLGSTGVKWTS